MARTDLRSIPAVDALLAAMDSAGAPHALRLEAAREVLAVERASRMGGSAARDIAELRRAADTLVSDALAPSLRPVINATGVILQTNLGRAPLSENALEALRAVASGYSNLEFDVRSGARGSRHDHVRDLLRRTTGAEDGIVVNNNAAALFMVLQVFARDREVVISRGQAVEIGGGFRIPDVLRQAGARLVEVGTTNRTYPADYASAITAETAALLRVHTSNFRVIGFTHDTTAAELGEIGREHGVLVFDDLGSGCLVDTARFGLAHEPTVQESLTAGVDLALFSGDKLLGGPQCGIIVGRRELVERLRKHPLARALRVDKLTIAALNATLLSYVSGREAEEIPVWRMLAQPPDVLKRRARRWAKAAGDRGAVIASRSMVGGGSLPGGGVPTWCAAIEAEGGSGSGADDLARQLRLGEPAILARIEDGRVLLDPRTVAPVLDGAVAAAIARAAASDTLSRS